MDKLRQQHQHDFLTYLFFFLLLTMMWPLTDSDQRLAARILKAVGVRLIWLVIGMGVHLWMN